MVQWNRTNLLHRLHQLAVVAEVAEAGGLTPAAARLGIGKSAVSHHVATLEREIGLALLVREARSVRLTAAGAALAAHARAMVQEAELAMAAAQEAEAPQGTIRLSMPGGIADDLLIPMFAAFLDAHPRLSLDVVATDALLDMTKDRIDLAFRLNAVDDGAFVARPLHRAVDILVAAPAYLAVAPAIRQPSDLADHPFIGFSRYGARQTYEVEGPGAVRTEVTFTPRVTTTSGLSIKRWALAGLGIARMPAFTVADELADGRLERILPDHVIGQVTLFALFMPARYRPANVRRLIDFAVAYFGADAAVARRTKR